MRRHDDDDVIVYVPWLGYGSCYCTEYITAHGVSCQIEPRFIRCLFVSKHQSQ